MDFRLSSGEEDFKRQVCDFFAREESAAARRVSLFGAKIHGGTGMTVEHDMQLYFRRAKAAELAFGDGDFHREVVARKMGL